MVLNMYVKEVKKLLIEKFKEEAVPRKDIPKWVVVRDYKNLLNYLTVSQIHELAEKVLNRVTAW